jgi:ATP-binding cassette subfamily B multidrug efflux pump
MGIGGIVLAVHQDVALSVVVIVIVPLLLLIMYLIVRRLIPLYRDGQNLLDRSGGILREQIIGVDVIRAFVRQDYEAQRFARANARLTANNLQSALLVAGMLPMIMLVVNISSVAVIWFGGHRIQGGLMNLGALTAFITYIMQILLAIMMAMYVLMTAPRAAACAERIQAVLDTEPSVDAPGLACRDRMSAIRQAILVSCNSTASASPTRGQRHRCSRTSVSPRRRALPLLSSAPQGAERRRCCT